ncbi:MAG: hypothetical protein HKL81_05160 [Acidimicrobiaceae bacterium]|nr:hypothetical protein [Acidimicrobiaceae bacterium]
MYQMATLENVPASTPSTDYESPKPETLNESTIDETLPVAQEMSDQRKAIEAIGVISDAGGDLAIELADLGGELAEILSTTKDQTAMFSDLAQTTSDLAIGARDLSNDTDALVDATALVATEMTLSKEIAEVTRDDILQLSEWITSTDKKLHALTGTISSISAIASSIDSIAQQTHILALNARIEAARAGVAGRGFEVIAGSVRGLSDKTISAAGSISETIEPLIQGVTSIGKSAIQARQKAARAEASSKNILEYVAMTQQQVVEVSERIESIDGFVQTASRLSTKSEVAFASLRAGFEDSTEGLRRGSQETSELISVAEWLLEEAILSGANCADERSVRLAVSCAKRIAGEFESLIDVGHISKEDLFNTNDLEIASTSSARSRSKLSEIYDSVLPGIQGPPLEDPSIIYLFAMDKNSFIPSPNSEHSPSNLLGSKVAATGSEPSLDKDRIASGAAQNTKPFYIQTFRRALQEDNRHQSMKDISAPIFVRGEHWGALRIGISANAELSNSTTSEIENRTSIDETTQSDINKVIDEIAKVASELGLRLAEVAADVTSLTTTATSQIRLFEELEDTTRETTDSNRLLYSDAQALIGATLKVEEQMKWASEASNTSQNDVSALVSWIESAEAELDELYGAISQISRFASSIDSIAQQTHILALNARVEAARVGDKGRSFAVIADAVRDLSDETIKAAKKIEVTILPLAKSIEEMRESAINAKERAAKTQQSSRNITSAVSRVNGQLEELAKRIRHVNSFIISANNLSEVAVAGYINLTDGFRVMCERLRNTSDKVENLVKVSEWLLAQVVDSGAITQDKEMVDILQMKVEEIREAYERALRDGRAKDFELFDTNYIAIPGTDPQQFLSKFTYVSEEILPKIIDPPLENSSVDYLVLHDNNGYIPIHNRNASQPQGSDPVWNNQYSRHRRIYSDKVAKKAAESLAPFIIQIYRRDLGGGHYSLIKDVSAPLYIKGRKWGCVRLGYGVSSKSDND